MEPLPHITQSHAQGDRPGTIRYIYQPVRATIGDAPHSLVPILTQPAQALAYGAYYISACALGLVAGVPLGSGYDSPWDNGLAIIFHPDAFSACVIPDMGLY